MFFWLTDLQTSVGSQTLSLWRPNKCGMIKFCCLRLSVLAFGSFQDGLSVQLDSNVKTNTNISLVFNYLFVYIWTGVLGWWLFISVQGNMY